MLRVEDLENAIRLLKSSYPGTYPRLTYSVDLVNTCPTLYISDINVVSVSPGINGIIYVRYSCTNCGHEFTSIDKGQVTRCPLCGKAATRLDVSFNVSYRKAKILVFLKDAGPTYVDAFLLGIVNNKILSIRGGRYSAIIYPTLINDKPHILVLDIINTVSKRERWRYIHDSVLRYNDFITRLSIILESFAIDKVYGMYEEKALLLAAIVGAGEAYISGRPITDILNRYWLNIVWFGPAECAKSKLADYVLNAVPDGKAILLTGSRQTLPGLVMSGYGGQLMLGPFAILDGDETDFGILIIEEAERLPQEHVLELKHALEHGKHGRALGTTGYMQVYTRCGLVMIGNMYEEHGTDRNMYMFPTWMYDPAILTRMDAVMISMHPDQEGEVSNIVRWKLRGGIYSTISPEDWASYLKHCRKHRVTILIKDIENVLEHYRKEIATDLNSLFKVSIKGFRIIDSLLRIAIALAKLTLCNVVTSEHVEFAARLIETMLSRIRTLRETHLRPITKYQLTKLLFDEGLIEHVLPPDRAITFDELYERLKHELLDRGYMLSRTVLEQVLSTPLAKTYIYNPEPGKLKLAKTLP